MKDTGLKIMQFLRTQAKKVITGLKYCVQWIRIGRTWLPLQDFVRFLVNRPNTAEIAQSLIREIKEVDNFFVVSFKNTINPLFYPIVFTKSSLFQLIEEQSSADNWHCYEINETKVGPQDVVVDCGAAEGLFSFLVADRCSKVYAIEPVPEFEVSLRKTFHRFDNVEIVPFALADKPGMGALTGSGVLSRLEPNAHGATTRVTTIDEQFADKNIPINYIKADLEGHELLMLEGARETIRRFKPKIAITTYHEANHATLISELLDEIDVNYRIKLVGMSISGRPIMLHAWVD